MNYYKRHLGDYAKDAGHLTMLEHGAYNLLIDRYYSVERPIQIEEAMKVCRARSAAEREAVESVLREFFTDCDKGFRHGRCDEEIAAYNEKSNRNRELGKMGGRPKKKETQTVSKNNPDGFQNETERVSKNNPSHKPLAIKDQKPPIVPQTGDASSATDGHSVILDSYHATLPACQRIEVLNPKRKRRLAAAVKLAKQVCASQGWEYVPDQFWPAYWTQCAADKWMRGEVPNPNNPAWKQNLDVLLAEDRFAGVMDKAIDAMRGGA